MAGSGVEAQELPEPVRQLARERGLGEPVSVRRELSLTGALVKGGIGVVGGLGLLILVGFLADEVFGESDIFGAIARPFSLVGLVAFVWGLVVIVRGLVVGSRAHYQFAGGLIAQRRSGLLAVAWPDVEQLEARYNRKTRDLVGYRVQAAGGQISFMIPLVVTGDRDPFIDSIADRLRAHGRPVR